MDESRIQERQRRDDRARIKSVVDDCIQRSSAFQDVEDRSHAFVRCVLNREREAFIAGFNAHRHLPDETTVAEAYERWRQGRDG